MKRLSLHVIVLAAAALAMPSAASAVSWTAQTAVDPAGATTSELTGVSCALSNACTGVGRYTDSLGSEYAFAEGWNGSIWRLSTVPVPSGAVSSDLTDVYCTSSAACTAVGTSSDAFGAQSSMIVAWNGSVWRAQTPAAPPAGALGAGLTGISCTSSTACTAVGAYTNASGVSQPLAMRWGGATWVAQTVPVHSGHLGTYPASVSCSTSTACSLAGTYLDSAGVPKAFVAGWNGASWSTQTGATPPTAAATFLNSISCTASNACTAVGYATTAGGVAFVAAQRWTGAWANQSPTSPAGISGGVLTGVRCTGASACQAVGYTYDASFVRSSLAESWNGAVWAAPQTTPSPAGATDTTLSGVACTSSVQCTGVGYQLNGGVQTSLALRYQ